LNLGQLVAEVSIICGDKVVGEYFGAPEIKRAIGDVYRYYTMPLIFAGTGYFVTQTFLDIIAQQETIDLSVLTPKFWATSKLWRKLSTGYMPMHMNEQRYKFMSTIGIGTGDTYIPDYHYRGMNLILSPIPIAPMTAAIKMDYVYIPDFPNQTSADNYVFDINFPTVFELNVKLRTAIKLLETKDATGGVSDTGTLIQELAQADAYFQDTLPKDENIDRVEYSGINYNHNLM